MQSTIEKFYFFIDMPLDFLNRYVGLLWLPETVFLNIELLDVQPIYYKYGKNEWNWMQRTIEKYLISFIYMQLKLNHKMI